MMRKITNTKQFFGNLSYMNSTALLLILLSFASHAAEWQEVKSPVPGVSVSIDSSSINTTEYIVKGWVKFDYKVPREYQGKQLSQETSQRQVNCQEKIFWVMDGYGLPRDGSEPIRIYSTAEYWMTPAPDSKDEVAYLALCQKAKSLMDIVIEHADKAFQVIRGIGNK